MYNTYIPAHRVVPKLLWPRFARVLWVHDENSRVVGSSNGQQGVSVRSFNKKSEQDVSTRSSTRLLFAGLCFRVPVLSFHYALTPLHLHPNFGLSALVSRYLVGSIAYSLAAVIF